MRNILYSYCTTTMKIRSTQDSPTLESPLFSMYVRSIIFPLHYSPRRCGCDGKRRGEREEKEPVEREKTDVNVSLIES